MGVLSDWQIKAEGIIDSFTNAQRMEGVITYGVSSYGYDLRTGRDFQVFSSTKGAGGIIDPKNFKAEFLEEQNDVSHIIIPPNAFALCGSMERLTLPRDVIGVVVGKSTYARCGIICNVTPLEPEWRGQVTIEISNTTPLPAKIYAGEGIAQVLFLRADGVTQFLLSQWKQKLVAEFSERASDDPNYDPAKAADEFIAEAIRPLLCTDSYADKKGRYQDQSGIVLPCVRPTLTV